jgi:hypothetical protein
MQQDAEIQYYVYIYYIHYTIDLWASQTILI